MALVYDPAAQMVHAEVPDSRPLNAPLVQAMHRFDVAPEATEYLPA